MAASSQSALSGSLLLLVYSAGMGVPFVLAALAFDWTAARLAVVKRHYRGIQVASGAILVVFGVLLALGVVDRLACAPCPPSRPGVCEPHCRRPSRVSLTGGAASRYPCRRGALARDTRTERGALAAAAELRRLVAGRVSTTAVSRWLYSTDSSGYRVVPEAVLVAGDVGDLAAAAAVAAEHGLPVTVRGAGSSLAGQAIGPGLVVDCFKLDRIVAIDPDRRTARVEPGVVQASLNAAAAPYGLEFGPDTSTVDQATIAGMVGNNSSGSRSIVYGQSKDKVRRIAAVLSGGDGVVLGPGVGDGPATRVVAGTRP